MNDTYTVFQTMGVGGKARRFVCDEEAGYTLKQEEIIGRRNPML